MKFKVAVYQVESGFLEIESNSLNEAISSVKEMLPNPNKFVYGAKLGGYHLDLITTYATEQPKAEIDSSVPQSDAKVDASDSGKATNIRAYEPIIMPKKTEEKKLETV